MLSRPRRNRKSEVIRNMVSETRLHPSDFIFPLFICEGKKIKQEIKTIPGTFRFSLDQVLLEIESCLKLGINAFILFPVVPEKYKDQKATYSYHKNNFYLASITAIKKKFPNICLISDVAMDPYSSDGHDGYVQNGQILNDKSLPILANMAIAQAEAGIDIIGPSDMMDGRVGYLRNALDQKGFQDTSIMSYTAKYASAFYGPFRDALDSAPKKGDKKTYQMDSANSVEALREAFLDLEEGADFLMIKPALHYLDVIYKLHEVSTVPIVSYHVSGECAMLKFGAQNGLFNYDKALLETFLSLKRAGSKLIISYLAKDLLKMV